MQPLIGSTEYNCSWKGIPTVEQEPLAILSRDCISEMELSVVWNIPEKGNSWETKFVSPPGSSWRQINVKQRKIHKNNQKKADVGVFFYVSGTVLSSSKKLSSIKQRMMQKQTTSLLLSNEFDFCLLQNYFSSSGLFNLNMSLNVCTIRGIQLNGKFSLRLALEGCFEIL